MSEILYQKNCPSCKTLQTYSNKYKLERAIIANSFCEKCSRNRPSKKRQDLTGNIYGRLVVIGFHEKRGLQQYWKCKCGCGNETIIRHSHLTRQTVRSCGCSHFYVQGKHPHWKGVGEISGSYLNQIQKSAQVRGLKVEITNEEMWEKFLLQNKKCALTGIELRFDSCLRKRDGNASLDRIDSAKGYTKDNVQWVHKTINVMKQDLNEGDFFNWCRLVVERRMS